MTGALVFAGANRLTPRVLVAWTLAWSLAAAVIVVTAVAAEGDEVVTLQASGYREATLASVTARVASIAASGVETVVVVTFTGREDEGPTIEKGRAYLRFDDGSVLPEQWGSSNGRTLTMRFRPLPGDRALEAVLIPGVAIADWERAVNNQPSLEPVGSFVLGVDATMMVREDSRERALDATVPFGAGELIITRVVVSGGLMSIHGRIAGYSRDEIHNSLVLDTPTLTLPGARTATYLGTRIGFAEDPGVFEMQFEDVPATEGRAELALGTIASPDAQLPSATIVFDLP